MVEQSVGPMGVGYEIPDSQAHAAEFERVKALADAARSDGKEIVVVVGLGFVGAVMAAIIADSEDPTTGRPGKFVIGYQRPSRRSYWKVPVLNRGKSPVKSEDPTVDELIARCVDEKKTLTATYVSESLSLADCVVVDVQCDYIKQDLGNMRSGECDMSALEDTLKTIGANVPADCLVLIETTVAPGTTEYVAYPIMKAAFAKRGITSDPVLAHSFERVMPGREYVSSIRNFWRVCAGCNDYSRKRVERFLTDVLNTEDFPLTVMDRPIESETTKIVENTYRATILALLNEWSLFAERNGVDLVKVIEAIRMRPTHSNIMFPGPGIGGYCLPKDGGLGFWAYRRILGFVDGENIFRITPQAIDINDTRGLHVAELAREVLRERGLHIAGAKILVCGASYRQDVGDTRYSGSEVVVRKLAEMRAEIRVHDPYVKHWDELENQEAHLTDGVSLARFFTNQTHLEDLTVAHNLPKAVAGIDAIILAVPHDAYLNLSPDEVVEWAGGPIAVIDCFGILRDEQIRRYFELGCEVKALGRGHVTRIKEDVRRTV